MYAIKRELKLNNKERTLMAKHAGFSRVVYNYGLSLYNQLDHKEYKGGLSKKITTIKKVLTNYTKNQPEFAWMNELSSTVYQSAFKALQTAFSRFFKGLAEYPNFKRKKDSNSFTVYDSNGVVLLNSGKKIKIPTLGTFRLKEKLSARAAISDLGLYEFRRQLVYKQANYATMVELVDRWYPSSKTCSVLILTNTLKKYSNFPGKDYPLVPTIDYLPRVSLQLLWLIFLCFGNGAFRGKAVENDASNQ